MKDVNEKFLPFFGLVLLLTFSVVYSARSSTFASIHIIKGANMPANQLLPDPRSSGQYWAFAEPDYAWKLLRDLGVNVIQVVGGPEGNVLHIQMNENHPYGRPYDAGWARNLERFLAKADSYGIKVVFHTMGTIYGTLMGIVAPMNSYQRQDPYTSIEDTLSLIDKLGGNNELGKNFIPDPRIAYWSPINEARLDYDDVRDWTIAVLERIKHYGGRTSVCVSYGELRYVDSFPYIIPMIGEYVDFLQAHSYQTGTVQSVSSKGSSADMYTPIYEAFSKDCESMVNGRGDFSIDQIMLTEFGCGNGAWRGTGRNITTTEKQQADYIKAVFDACQKHSISKIFYHEPINIRSETRAFGFVDYNGAVAHEPYSKFKSSLSSHTHTMDIASARAEAETLAASGTIYIRPDGSVDPSTAPIRRDGNQYILMNNILCDSIVIMSSNIAIDGQGYTIQSLGSFGNGFRISLVNGVTIRNTKIEAFRNGFYIESAANITIFGNQLTNNRYGIYLEHSPNDTIFGNRITNNEYGIEIWYSPNSTIQENRITDNEYGVRLWGSSNNSVSRNAIMSNNERGMELLDSSKNNSILENNVSSNWDGLYLSSSTNNILSNNDVNNNFRGIFLYDSSNNTFYHNNFMYNTQQVYDHSWDWTYIKPSMNNWNNSHLLGGNYWSNYNGVDLYSGLHQNETGSDGIGDMPYIVDADNKDYYPLMQPLGFAHDTSAPIINVISPENKTYTLRDIPLTFTLNEPSSWISYSLDTGINTTISGNTTITGLSEGNHNITIYSHDAAWNMGNSDIVHFTVDTVAPSIEIISPNNKTYTTNSVSFSFTLSEPTVWIGFSLDGHANETVASTNTTKSGLSDGPHSLIVFASDVAGNTGVSETLYFSVETPPSGPPPSEAWPLWIVATIVASATAAVALLVYAAKIKRTARKTK